MEAPRLLLLSSSLKQIIPLSSNLRNPNFSYSSSCFKFVHCCFTKKRPPTKTTISTSSSYWDSNAESFRSNRFKFNFDDELSDEDEYDNYDFKWGESPKRKWWSDDDDNSERGAGVVEEVIDRVWFFKVLRSFGWLLPAIMMSMLLATGPKAFLMALALPLGQSALSFAIDKVFGRIQDKPKSRPRPKSKRKPFARAASYVEVNEEELDESSGSSEARQGYQSWVATEDGPVKQNVDQRKPSFGGWDELDRRQRSEKATTRRRRPTAGVPPRQGVEKAKMSRRGRRREAPLLLRLLISVFPFLGSWTKLL
ncbi:transmembrane protein [Thalictrum thalictroides]|uniref:Transmembrane protein n=1 Tax=Thalictrum thalictroides TaxID=46969 RepID=A0A7J6X5T1_THATH|nr:transmembrane protein [Thalictrum thalictroides]